MSYTPSFLINHEQLIKYNTDNENIFEWEYFPHENDSPIKIISEAFPFSIQFGSLVRIKETEFAYIPTEFSFERVSLVGFLNENNIEHYIFGS
ncbi:hypothetical protein [Flavobacterium psychrophilum]|uniref:Uncharacterized protein n=1 Tax=Flavobacterium psychrophilum TaxID=96345 RepID=A0A7U2NE64_FLAPS|nr:hypothetical protein [Flavobacterium psychrophilum]QRE03535.1 hypothetical protein H0H26_11695 [Flavobacterium psychrophilum]